MNREVNQQLKRIIHSLDEAAGAFRVMSSSDRRDVGIADASAGVMRYTGQRPKGVEITFEPGDADNSRHLALYTFDEEDEMHGWSAEVPASFSVEDAEAAANELLTYLKPKVDPNDPENGVQLKPKGFRLGKLKWQSHF